MALTNDDTMVVRIDLAATAEIEAAIKTECTLKSVPTPPFLLVASAVFGNDLLLIFQRR